MLFAVRFNDDVVQQFKDKGQLKELDVSHQPLAIVKAYEGKEHYFFTIIPQKLSFKAENNLSVIFPIEKKEHPLTLSSLAYKLFLMCLIREYHDGRTSRMEWSDEILNNIEHELRAFGDLRIMARSHYYSQEDYYEFSGFYSY